MLIPTTQIRIIKKLTGMQDFEANNLISQYSQTSTIIGALQNKSPVPAYVVGYATNGLVPDGYNYTYFGSSSGGCQTCRG